MKLRFKAILGTAAIFAGMFTSMIGANAKTNELHQAVQYGNLKQIESYKVSWPSIYRRMFLEEDEYGRVPLMFAEDVDVVNALTEGLSDDVLNKALTYRDMDGRTALHCAANAEVAKRLIELGADLFARDEHRRLPIHYLVKLGDRDFIKWLIEEKGVWFNLDDENIWVHGERLQGHRPLYRLQEYIREIIDTKGPESSKLAGLREVEEYLVSIGGISK